MNAIADGNGDGHALVESRYAWWRLAAALLLSTIGGVGTWSVVVALPAIQIEFGSARGAASMPYTLTMIGFGIGGVILGRWSDRIGAMRPVALGAMILGVGCIVASTAGNLWQFALAQGVLMGFGCAATFSPLLADTSRWFDRRRGIAVGIFASGNYLAGAIWPPIVQHFIASAGWRATYVGLGVFVMVTMVPLAWVLRRGSPTIEPKRADGAPDAAGPLGMSATSLHVLLMLAAFSCCVAMSMPQVHLVAYCGDLGYGPARGAQMLSLMLGCGVISRLTFGWISDRIGGLRTLLLGSGLQCVALLLFLPFDGLVSLYVIAAMFGLFQGGIVPAYAIIVREYFPAKEAGSRVSAVITLSLFGMALGGWMSGAIFDLTGSYAAAFVNGSLWNLLNLSIAFWLLRRARAPASPQSGLPLVSS